MYVQVEFMVEGGGCRAALIGVGKTFWRCAKCFCRRNKGAALKNGYNSCDFDCCFMLLEHLWRANSKSVGKYMKWSLRCLHFNSSRVNCYSMQYASHLV